MTEGSDPDRDPFPDAAARDEFLDLADDVMRWRLPAQRWLLMLEALQRVNTSITSSDRGGFERAVADVELLGPIRATRVGAEPPAPAPEQVRKLTNELVHRVGGRLDTHHDTDRT